MPGATIPPEGAGDFSSERHDALSDAGPLPTVFISYTSPNRREAERVRRALERHNFLCWMAPRSVVAGRPWPEQIVAAIEACRVIVVVFSEETNHSREVAREVLLANNADLLVIAYRLTDALPQQNLKYLLGLVQWLEAFSYPRRTALRKLVGVIRSHLSEAGPRPVAANVPVALVSGEYEDFVARLAEAMVQKGDVAVEFRATSPRDSAVVTWLVRKGEIRSRSAGTEAGVWQIAPATSESGERILGRWIAGNGMALERSEFWRQVDRFSWLADALARYLAENCSEAAQKLLGELIRDESERSGPLLAGMLLRCADLSERLTATVERIVGEGGLVAARGLLLAAQQAMALGENGRCQAWFDALRRWAETKPRDDALRHILVCVAEAQGHWLRRYGEFAQAEKQYRRAWAEAQQLGDQSLQRIVGNNVALAILESPAPSAQRSREAIAILEDNVEHMTQAADGPHLAVAYSLLGDAYAGTDPQRAEAYLLRDVRLCGEMRDTPALAEALDRLGVFFADRDRFQKARRAHIRAMKLCERFVNPRLEARLQANWGRCLLRRGHRRGNAQTLAEACGVLQRACDRYSTLDEPRQFAPTLENLGRTLYVLGRHVDGLRRLQMAIAQYQRWAEGQARADELRREIEGLP